MTYEQVTFEDLPNRAGHVPEFLGKKETPEQAFCVLYQKPDGSWWNGQECPSEELALATVAQWRKMGSSMEIRIVQAHKTERPPIPPVEIAQPIEAPKATAPFSEPAPLLSVEEMGTRRRARIENAPSQDAFDEKVKELNRLAAQLPGGSVGRLHQDHIPLGGVIIEYYDASREGGVWSPWVQHVIENAYAISEAREYIQKLLRRPGRPVEREGTYRRITLEIREDLLAKIDASGTSRREYIEALLDK